MSNRIEYRLAYFASLDQFGAALPSLAEDGWRFREQLGWTDPGRIPMLFEREVPTPTAPLMSGGVAIGSAPSLPASSGAPVTAVPPIGSRIQIPAAYLLVDVGGLNVRVVGPSGDCVLSVNLSAPVECRMSPHGSQLAVAAADASVARLAIGPDARWMA